MLLFWKLRCQYLGNLYPPGKSFVILKKTQAIGKVLNDFSVSIKIVLNRTVIFKIFSYLYRKGWERSWKLLSCLKVFCIFKENLMFESVDVSNQLYHHWIPGCTKENPHSRSVLSGGTALLKPHCIQSSRVLVPAGTSKSTLHRHGIQAVTRVMAYVADAVTLWRCLQQRVLAALN
jgi:hypothetical protein